MEVELKEGKLQIKGQAVIVSKGGSPFRFRLKPNTIRQAFVAPG